MGGVDDVKVVAPYGRGFGVCWLLGGFLARVLVCLALVVRVLGALAFPCFVSGLLALPLCGAALTFFAAAKKDKQRKRLEAPAKWAPWSARGSGATGIRVLAHSALVTKESSAPTPHCVRRGRVCMGNQGLRLRCVGAERNGGVET
jgi:hypothetical protein